MINGNYKHKFTLKKGVWGKAKWLSLTLTSRKHRSDGRKAMLRIAPLLESTNEAESEEEKAESKEEKGEEEEEVLGQDELAKLTPLQRRLVEVRQKMNKARKENRKEVRSEYDRIQEIAAAGGSEAGLRKKERMKDAKVNFFFSLVIRLQQFLMLLNCIAFSPFLQIDLFFIYIVTHSSEKRKTVASRSRCQTWRRAFI